MTDQYVYVVVYRLSPSNVERIYGTYGTLEKACYALLRELTNLTTNSARTENITLVWEKVIAGNGMDYTAFWSYSKEDGKTMGRLFVNKVRVE